MKKQLYWNTVIKVSLNLYYTVIYFLHFNIFDNKIIRSKNYHKFEIRWAQILFQYNYNILCDMELSVLSIADKATGKVFLLQRSSTYFQNQRKS